ncbi:hypothetical protein PgNI_06310 [Pyricularia grisea]|uniref:BAH domain-containing protein n=1 Tax=Pyricularia grisea TaxID=148305 RepID=A0A6P8B506_PYRGI|nr:hypothetical protein PgNI_06310 [Pyricularia grisea]TLD10340.1 hypothetical protein PgNI_06310 [Pyricularia grisea]
MSSSKKRSRTDTVDDTRADCPFEARLVDPKEKELKTQKRHKAGGNEEEDVEAWRKRLTQLSPFAPTGKFKTHETMDVPYAIEPAKKWMDMTRYNSFVLNGVKYFSEGFIFVANESSIERIKATENKGQPVVKSNTDEDWVARILEIRASDEHHVYARVYWMYWPDELPEHTVDGKKFPKGRQPYHGRAELIASNHMDVINVVSVTSQAQVNQMIENDDDDTQGALYWRQALDVRTNELSTVETICSCGQPANPDNILIGCSKENCGNWLHQDCLIHDALLKTWERLGADKPYVAVKEETKETRRPLSPTEPGAAASAQQSIDVKATSIKDVEIKMDDVKTDGPIVKTSEEPASSVAPSETPVPRARRGTSTPNPTPVPQKGGRGRGRGRRKADKPYEGHFEAKTRMDLTPPVIEITDMRESIVGGQKSWEEPMDCLICKKRIV